MDGAATDIAGNKIASDARSALVTGLPSPDLSGHLNLGDKYPKWPGPASRTGFSSLRAKDK